MLPYSFTDLEWHKGKKRRHRRLSLLLRGLPVANQSHELQHTCSASAFWNTAPRACGWRRAAQRLLPLHFNFCRTTLKNEACGSDASGSVFFALRMVTTDPRSTWIGFCAFPRAGTWDSGGGACRL